MASRNRLMSNPDSAGAPQEVLKKSPVPPSSWTACGINPHSPWQHWGKPSLITTLNRNFGNVCNGTVLSQQKAAVHWDASHGTPSLLNGGSQKLPESDPQPMVRGLELDFLSDPSNPTHYSEFLTAKKP